MQHNYRVTTNPSRKKSIFVVVHARQLTSALSALGGTKEGEAAGQMKWDARASHFVCYGEGQEARGLGGTEGWGPGQIRWTSVDAHEPQQK